MKILYIDTTTQDLVVAIVSHCTVENFSIKKLGVRHSETLCNRVEDALRSSGTTWADLDAYACAVGPGSFTGIRIGISILKGYCFAQPKPCIAVNCLKAISFSEKCGNKGCAAIDAGNGYYFADYNNGVAPSLVSYEDKRACVAGRADGALQYLDGAVELIRKSFVNKEFVQEPEPVYIRKSQAEEQRG